MLHGLVTASQAPSEMHLPRLASLLKSRISVTHCIALLHVLSGRRISMAAQTGTTMGDGKAGVVREESDDVKRRTLDPSISLGRLAQSPTPTLGAPERYPSTL
jgi:hypothetical protein